MEVQVVYLRFWDNSPRVRLVKCLRSSDPDTVELERLVADLVSNVREFPDSLLWSILKKSEAALRRVKDEDAIFLITEIQRSANWEIQSRNRAT